jgi:eukaryotic-like serine/threonine-protein kinase
MLFRAIILIFLAADAFASQAPWPMFRVRQDLAGTAAGDLPDSLELRWSFKTDGPVKSSAAIDRGRVVVGSDDNHVYCLDLLTGERIWAFKTADAVEASPLILGDYVYVGSADTQLYKLDLATGALAWTYATDGKILGGANWIQQPTDNTQKILVGSYDSKLHCVDAGTGKAAWTVTTENYVNGAPAVADGKIVFGGCDGLVHVISAATGEELAKVEAGAYIAGSVALKEGFAYLGHYGNEVVCVDVNAENVAWRYKESGFPFFSSPAVTDERVIIGGRDKRVHCLERATGKQLWEFKTGGKVDSSPVVCGDKIAFGSEDGRLYVLSIQDGKELWSYEIGKPLTASPAIANGMIIIGSEDGAVYAFGAPPSEGNGSDEEKNASESQPGTAR